MAIGDSNYTFNLVTEDPCYGCKHAYRIPDREIDCIFERRFGCMNNKRRDELVEIAVGMIQTDMRTVGSATPSTLETALSLLNDAEDMDVKRNKHGYFDCEDCLVSPSCYERG